MKNEKRWLFVNEEAEGMFRQVALLKMFAHFTFCGERI
jgi:hypothetical protein